MWRNIWQNQWKKLEPTDGNVITDGDVYVCMHEPIHVSVDVCTYKCIFKGFIGEIVNIFLEIY